MKDIGTWIESIVEDLVSSDKKLSEILLKVQVLAHRIKNDELKTWVNDELNGYVGKDKPEYRVVPSAVFGNLIQNAGFNILTRNNVPLPVEYLGEEYWKMLLQIRVDSKVAELEKMAQSKGDLQINVPHFICAKVTEMIRPWGVDTAWQTLTQNSIEGILSTIRSTLLNFLLELQSEFGEGDYNKLFERESKVNDIYNKTIGSITGEKIHISVGNDNIQATNYGKDTKLNVGKGDNLSQTINASDKSLLEDFIKELKSNKNKLGLRPEDQEDLDSEVERLETQIQKESPRKSIVQSGLKVIYDLLIGVAGNAASGPLIETAKTLIENI